MRTSDEVNIFYKWHCINFRLRPAQYSLIDFLDNTQYGIATSYPSVGMTTGMQLYLLYKMVKKKNQQYTIIFRSDSTRNYFLSTFKALMQPNGIHLRCNRYSIENEKSQNIMSCYTMDSLRYKLRGQQRITNIIFDDWYGYGPYSKNVEENFPEISEMLSPDCNIHFTSTDNLSFAMIDYEEGGLMHDTILNKSKFKLWNYNDNKSIDELLNM